MKHEAKACTQCKPHCRVEVVVTRDAALDRYWDLFRLGLFPSLCQRNDGAFQVCHGNGQAQQAKPQRVSEMAY